MCTFLGASTQLEPQDLDLSMVKETKVLYLEGYLWDSPAAKRAFIAAAEACREAGGQVALSLSDGFCVDRHRDGFLDLVSGHVDVLFANEAEIKSLYQTDDFGLALSDAWLLLRDRHHPFGKVVCSTAINAGTSVFSAWDRWWTPRGWRSLRRGFLHAYTQGESLERCAELGALCAGQIVTQLGARSQVGLKELRSQYLR